MNNPYRPIRRLFDTLAPARCLVCDDVIDDGFICDKCRGGIPRSFHYQLSSHHINNLAPSARVDYEIFAAFPYYLEAENFDEPLYSRLIWRIKQGNARYMARALGALIVDESRAVRPELFDGIAALVPVPMHWTRRLKRGYNQAEEIARGISELTGIPVINALSTGYHRAQKTKTLIGRITAGSQNALHARKADTFDGAHIALIDDVITTGATAVACGKALKKANPTLQKITYISAAIKLNY